MQPGGPLGLIHFVLVCFSVFHFDWVWWPKQICESKLRHTFVGNAISRPQLFFSSPFSFTLGPLLCHYL
jgi:hypothetical protein